MSLRQIIGFCEVGDTRFELYSGWATTLYHAHRRSFQLIDHAYRSLKISTASNMKEKQAAVYNVIRKQWMELTGGTAPEIEVKSTPHVSRKRTDSAAYLIREGIRADLDADTIVEIVKRRHPNGKADKSFVSYQACHMRKRGEIPPGNQYYKESE